MATTTPRSSRKKQTGCEQEDWLITVGKRAEVLAYVSARMPRHWWYSLRIKCFDDWSGANYLEHHLWMVASQMARREQWNIPIGREVVRKMAGLAIAEMADPSRFKHDAAWQIRAAWLGVSKSRWFAMWRDRYDMIHREFNDWPSRGARWTLMSPERIAAARQFDRARLAS